MKKTYICPEMDVVKLNAYQPLLTESLPVNSGTINSGDVLSPEFDFDWDDDDEQMSASQKVSKQFRALLNHSTNYRSRFPHNKKETGFLYETINILCKNICI